jgi:predicted helicase
MPYEFHQENHQFTSKFDALAAIGKTLMDLHLHYEDAPEYPLEWHWTEPKSWHVERMRFNKDKTIILVNPSLFLSGIPPEAHGYMLGNKSALEWVIDQYRVTEDKTGFVSDPNRKGDPEYIARLVCKVCFVSVETVRLQKVMSEITVPEDWVGLDGLENIFEAEEQKGGVKPDDMPGGSLWED